LAAREDKSGMLALVSCESAVGPCYLLGNQRSVTQLGVTIIEAYLLGKDFKSITILPCGGEVFIPMAKVWSIQNLGYEMPKEFMELLKENVDT
jgi:hypothetical protein